MHDVDNYTLGKGIIYFNRLVASTYQGYRDLGNSPEMSVSIPLEILDHFSSRSGIKSKDKRTIQSATPMVSFTLDEINISNLELMGMGTAEEIIQMWSEGTGASISVVQRDRYYMDTTNGKRKLKSPTYLKYDGGSVIFVVGETVTGAGGATATVAYVIGSATEGILVLTDITGTFVNDEAITGSGTGAATANGTQITTADGDVLVTNSTGTTIYTLTTDYTVDTDVGRLFIVSTGSIAANSTIYWAYGCEKCTYTKVTILDDSSLEGEFHFISDNPEGGNYELLFWRVSLTPNGDTSFIGDGWSTLSFTGEVLEDETNHATDPYGYIIEEPVVETTTTT